MQKLQRNTGKKCGKSQQSFCNNCAKVCAGAQERTAQALVKMCCIARALQVLKQEAPAPIRPTADHGESVVAHAALRSLASGRRPGWQGFAIVRLRRCVAEIDSGVDSSDAACAPRPATAASVD